MRKKYKYMIELNEVMDFFTGEITIKQLVSNNNYQEQQEEACTQIEKIIRSIAKASEVYGEIREFHLFYTPTFEYDWGSCLINIVKINNNGTTIVFCDDCWVVPEERISKIICL